MLDNLIVDMTQTKNVAVSQALSSHASNSLNSSKVKQTIVSTSTFDHTPTTQKSLIDTTGKPSHAQGRKQAAP